MVAVAAAIGSISLWKIHQVIEKNTNHDRIFPTTTANRYIHYSMHRIWNVLTDISQNMSILVVSCHHLTWWSPENEWRERESNTDKCGKIVKHSRRWSSSESQMYSALIIGRSSNDPMVWAQCLVSNQVVPQAFNDTSNHFKHEKVDQFHPTTTTKN